MSQTMNTTADPSVPYSPTFIVAESLDDLHGPSTGEVVLPNRLLWNPSEPFDLVDDEDLRAVMRIVLREARGQDDLAQYLNRESLIRLWGHLRLPRYIQAAWEARFPKLTHGAPNS